MPSGPGEPAAHRLPTELAVGGRVIIGLHADLAPLQDLLNVQALLSGVFSQLRLVHWQRLHHHRELVLRGPVLGVAAIGRHGPALLALLASPVVQGRYADARAA